MKKLGIFIIIFSLLSISLLYFNYLEESSDYFNEMIHVGDHDAIEIVLSPGELNQEKLYNLFDYGLELYHGNLSVPVIEERDEQEVYVKYVLFTSEDYFQNIVLTSGRTLLIDENESDFYMSTRKSSDPNQIAQIASFTNHKNFEIRTLKSCKLDRIFERTLTISFEKMSDLDNFIDLASSQGVTIQIKYGASNLSDSVTNPFSILVSVSFMLLMLVILYLLLHDYKKVAIQKMLGHSNLSIYMVSIIPILFAEIIPMIILSFLTFLLNNSTSRILLFPYFIRTYKMYFLMIITSILAFSIPFLYLKRIRITNMLKNKSPSKDIIRFNTVVKILLVVMFLFISSKQFNQLKVMINHYNTSYSYWDETKDYVVLGFKSLDIENHNFYSDGEKEKNKELYLEFNQKGAIYADFYLYMADIYQSNNILKYIKVNPNYLDKFPVFNEYGDQVQINESETDYIVLVPSKYREMESRIIEQFDNNIDSSGHCTEIDCDDVGHENELTMKRRNVKLIWIKNNQAFFSYRTDIAPNTGNCVFDPIIVVLTTSNGEVGDYNFVAGYMGNPLKIKVDNSNEAESEISQVFMKYYDLSKYNFPNHNVYETMKTEIANVRQQIYYQGLMMLLVLVMIGIVVSHNIIIYYSENKVKLAIQSFHGYKTFDKLEHYVFQIFMSWIVIFPISILINPSIIFLCFSVFFFLFEIAISVIVFVIVDKRNILQITKGG